MSTLVKKELFDKIKPNFTEITSEVDFKKEVSFAVQHFSKNTYLSGATDESKLKAVLNVAQTGLTLNPVLKLAYLVPRKSSYGLECCLEPSYQGLVKLVTDTGSASNIYSYPVYKGDEFVEVLGTSIDLIHKPKRESKEITHVYAVAVLPNGTKQIEVMTKADVEEIRDYSESYKAYKSGKIKSCIWVKNESEMYRKTVIRRLCKYLPKTERWEKLSTAINLDESDYEVSHGKINLIESLIETSLLSPEQRDGILMSLNTISNSEASETISYLKNNQIDPINSGSNYSQNDISKKLDEIK